MKALRYDQKIVQLSRRRRARLIFPGSLSPERIRAGEEAEREQARRALAWREKAERSSA